MDTSALTLIVAGNNRSLRKLRSGETRRCFVEPPTRPRRFGACRLHASQLPPRPLRSPPPVKRRENPRWLRSWSPRPVQSIPDHMAQLKGDGTAAGGGDQAQLVLLDVFASPYAQRVRIALAEKGLAYERAEEDLAAKSELLRRANPVHGKVPVLLHAGRPVCESLAILQYLDDAFPGTPPLLPAASDPYARARARFWAEYADRLHICGKRLWLPRGGGGEGEEEVEPEARAEMVAALRALEAELGGREFFGGAAFGYVDVAAVPFAAWFLVYERHGGFSVAEQCPGLAAWAARCARRESVAANVHPPEKVYDLVQEYRQWVLRRKRETMA